MASSSPGGAQLSGSLGTGGPQPKAGFPPSTDRPFCFPLGVAASGSLKVLKIIRWANRCVAGLGQRWALQKHLGMLCQLQFGACGRTEHVWFPWYRPDPACSHP